jgi:ABC-type antimicrobial peptide transport system permease subunit
VFLCGQLVFACVFITMSVMFAQNTTYMNNRPWGYDQADALYARIPDQASFEKLRDIMARNPNVVSISGSTHHVGKGHEATVLHFPDRDYEVDQLSVDAKYFETLGLELLEGRTFHDFDGSDLNTVLVNESLAKTLGGNAIGQVFRIDTIQHEVIGIIKEFHSYTFDLPIKPTIFKVAIKADYRFLSLKARSGTEIEVYKTLQAGWSELFPEIPFDGGLQQDVWGFYYEQIAIYAVVWKVFAFLAVSLATLGLYGLVRLNVEGRTKEFSIRKVLGAGSKNISVSVSSPYLTLVMVGLLVGAPLGQWLGAWLIDFANEYHMPIDFSGVSIAVLIMILVILATLSTQIRKVLVANPVEGLKVE